MNVRIHDLSKAFSGKEIFHGLDLELGEGFTCLYGPSGCGKTTLGRIIAGLEKADHGLIEGVCGAPTVLFQESRLLPTLSAYENVRCICTSKESAKLAKELFERLFFTSEDMNKLPSELSGGMMRRVAIVRAVVFATEKGGNFVLLDEPFTGLDPDTREEAAEILKTHLSGKVVLVITHDGEERELLCGNEMEFSSLNRSNGQI